MANILLLASSGLGALPEEFYRWIETYNQQGHTFIVGDSKKSDDILHRALSSIGAVENSVLYSLGSTISNRYKIKEHKFEYSYDSDKKLLSIVSVDDTSDITEITIKKEMDIQTNEQFYEFRDRQMIKDCDMGIIVMSGDMSKRLDKMIRIMNVYDKPCYILNA